MINGCDMIANLANLPDMFTPEGVKIKRAFPGDKDRILAFVEEHFSRGWALEAEHAINAPVPKCFVAVEDGKVIGFACYDSTALGYFGPIGVNEACRGRRIGEALLLRTLHAMREYGYGYAIIGWVGPAEFYHKIVGAEFIKDGNPENTVYQNMVSL